MPFETQVCLKLFDNLKAGLLFKYLLHIHTDANKYYQKDTEKHII